MKRRRVLYQWLGLADLWAMSPSLSERDRHELLTEFKAPAWDEHDLGPIKTLISQVDFDEVYILSHYPPQME